MKLIIFGVSGSIGKLLVLQALGLDHQVTAFVRHGNSSLAELIYKNLQFFEGDILSPRSLLEAIGGITLFFVCRKKDGIRALGTRNIIYAMGKLGVDVHLSVYTGCR